jgi:hypothetical protein
MHLPHFLAWIEVLWHHAHNGTLPPVPTGSTPVLVQPIDANKSAPAMGVTVAPLAVGVVNTGYNQAGAPVPIPVSDVAAASGVAADHGVAAVTSSGVVLPAGCVASNIKGAPGTVYLTVKSKTSDGVAFAIDEVADLYPVGSPEYNFLKANLERANGLEIVEGQDAIFPACCPLNTDGSLNIDKPMKGVIALPAKDRGFGGALPTVAAATAFYTGK